MTGVAWLAPVSAGIVALGAPAAIRPILHRVGAFDVPNERSSHVTPTLRGGGISLLLGWFAGALVALPQMRADSRSILLIVVMATTATALVGLAEDVRGVPALTRLGVQLAIGFGIGAGICLYFQINLWWSVLIAFGIAWYVNVTNFMDGINGISGAHGVVVGAAFASIGVITNLDWLTLGGMILAVVAAAFLPWNFARPGMFLGDVGSYLLGGSIVTLTIFAMLSGISAVAAMAPLFIYLADTTATIVRRSVRGEPILKAHRTHVYQRLTDCGLTHLGSTAVVTSFTVGTSLIAIAQLTLSIPAAASLGGAALLSLVYLALPRLLGNSLPAAPNTRLADVSLPADAPARPGFDPQVWAVLGASGFIGQAVVGRLREGRCEVRLVTAPRLRLDPGLSSGTQVAALASGEPTVGELSATLQGVDVVVNAAGLATPDGAATPEMYGANALLPAVVARAAQRADVPRIVHISSAAVQGRRRLLDESVDSAPFSPYSRSKALGERALLTIGSENATKKSNPDIVIVRATSVQGPSRATTKSLRRIAQSPLASVSAPGTQPTVVSSVTGLVEFVYDVGTHDGSVQPILLQPWEGLSVSDVIRLAGGREPHVLPKWLCVCVLSVGYGVGKVLPEVAGLARRIELMWFGQAQCSGWSVRDVESRRSEISAVLRGSAP